MDIRQLRHVAVLARERHFGRAADRLRITQSALTRSIQATEAQLDLRLFDRGREGVEPTRAGSQFLEDALHILRQMDVLKRNMALLSGRAIGEVHCGLGPMAAALVLPHILTRIACDHPSLHIRTRLGDVAEMQHLLLEGELDFAVLAYPLLEERADLSLHRVGRIHLGALVRSGHPLAGRIASEAEMAQFPILGGTGTNMAGAALSAAYAPTISCDNFEIARSVTLASDAIWISAESLADDRLTLVRGLTIAQPLDLVVASLARRTLSPPALLLIDMVAQALQSTAKGKGDAR